MKEWKNKKIKGLETDDDLSKYSLQKLGQIEGGKTSGKMNAESGNVVIAGRISATKQWKENRDRELQKCSKGGKINADKTSKPVIMCDMNGNQLKYFKNRTEATNFVNGNKPPLIQAIDKPNKSYKGYKWINP